MVTGAAQGIGRAVCHRLAERGATVVAVDLEEPRETLDLLEGVGRPGNGLRADVADPDQARRVGEEVRGLHGRCDILVNNAGLYPFIEVDELSYETWRRVVAVNLDAQFLMVKAVLPLMPDGAHIVNVTSNSIVTESPGMTAYMASKMGSIGFTRALANDLGHRGVTVNAVGPSLTRTPGIEATTSREYQEEISRRQAIKKVAEPDDITGAVLFLTSDDAHFVTGQTLMADGGMAKN